ncbi:MAG: hypothetical protein SF028_14210 [Candidatus Sumerlaeia bacterium]|nr:hypothetical protein [Candidatus Sumerlaeia bacterium]
MKTLTIIATIASATLLAATFVPTTANAQSPRAQRAPGLQQGGPKAGQRGPDAERGPRGEGRPGEFGKAAKFWENPEAVAFIGLSETQVAALAANFTTTQEALDALEGTTRDIRALIQEEMEADAPNMNTINALVDEGAKQRTDRMKITLGHRVAVQTTLSAEQEAKLKEWREEQRESFRERGAEVREALRDAETLEEAQAILDEAGLPPEMQERILDRWSQRHEEGAAPPAPGAKRGAWKGRGEGFAPQAGPRAGGRRGLPPLPPEDAMEDEF